MAENIENRSFAREGGGEVGGSSGGTSVTPRRDIRHIGDAAMKLATSTPSQNLRLMVTQPDQGQDCVSGGFDAVVGSILDALRPKVPRNCAILCEASRTNGELTIKIVGIGK